MKLKRTLLILPAALALTVVAVGIFYFGPYTPSGRREEILATLRLPDASTLFLVQRPNPSTFEPYTVELYRLYQNGTADTCLLGCEESYWWCGGLKLNGRTTVKVTSVGSTECLYDIETGVRKWTDKSYPAIGSKQGDYITLSNRLFRLGHRI
jgi:hypothetical protein